MSSSDILFISAQPDEPQFIWQSHVYLHNFLANGIAPHQCVAIFATKPGKNPSKELHRLIVNFPGVGFQIYDDTRDSAGKNYTASIQPHVIVKAYKKHRGWKDRHLFFHDCDIIFRRLPDFDNMLLTHPQCCLLSDTASYIGYEYIHDCCNKISAENNTIPPDHLLYRMCDVVGIDPITVKSNQRNTGGAQYLLSDVDVDFWEKVYLDSVKLKELFDSYNRQAKLKFETSHYIQTWTAGMWSYLWNLWLQGYTTVIHREMEFAFASAPSDSNATIIHMAGLTEEEKSTYFDKGDWSKLNPIESLRTHPYLFDNIEKNTVSHEYAGTIYDIVGIKQDSPRKIIPATHWRILTWHSASKFAWDVERLQFFFENKELKGEVIESGNAGSGYEASNAWLDDCSRFWGGRVHENQNYLGGFYLGLKFKKPCIPDHVKIKQRTGDHIAKILLLQYSQNGKDWETGHVTKLQLDDTEQSVFFCSKKFYQARQWRICSDQTESGFAWDVSRVTFAYNQKEQIGIPISSGYAENCDEYAPQNIFKENSSIWGGRPDVKGKFYIGIKSGKKLRVNHIVLEQPSSEHMTSKFFVQCSQDGEIWRTVKTVTGVTSGVNSVLLKN